MKYIFLIALFLLQCIPELSGQITDWGARTIPPSPVTHEYEKYINYNVSIYNGIPDISIPIYTIRSKELTIPITLSYHASGIKYRQESGEVGVGWTLNPGYRVSRTVYGRADERFEMPSNVYDSVDYYIGDPLRRDRYLSKFLTLSTSAVKTPFPYNNEELDGEYDLFNFMLPSASGSFVISDRQTGAIQTLEKSNLKFNYNTGTSSNGFISGILKFDVVDENGIAYHMGEHQPADNIFEASSNYGNLPTAWPLTHISTPLGENVHFRYTKIDAGGWNGHVKTATLMEANNCANRDSLSGYSETFGTDGAYATFFLDSIITEKEIIKILRTGTTHVATQVTDIDIYSLEGELIKNVSFYYSWNGYHNFLDSVKVFDKDQNSNEVYKFNYYRKDAFLPGEEFVADQWGFYKSTDAITKIYHAEFEDDPITINQVCLYVDPANPGLGKICNFYMTNAGFVSGDFINRKVNTEPELFSLKSITYPTGGKTEYEYEPNKVFATLDYGGGIRIKKISSNDLVSSQTLIKEYRYGTNESGYGNAQLFLNENFFATEHINLLILKDVNGFDKYGRYIPQRVTTYSTLPNTDIDITGYLSGFVSYPAVTEYQISTDPDKENGKIEYIYDLGTQYHASSFLTSLPSEPCQVSLQYALDQPRFVDLYSMWDKPQLVARNTYSTMIVNDVKSYSLVKEEQFVYTTDSGPEFSGLKVKEFVSADDYVPGLTNAYNPYLYVNSFWKYGEYSIKTGINLLHSKTEILHNGGGEITTLTEYDYNAKNQLNVVKSHKSDYIDQEEFTYPSDLAGLNANEPVKLLQDQHIIAPAIETRHYRSDINGSNKKLTGASYIEYHATEPLPVRDYSAKLTEAVQNFVPVSVSSGQIVKDNTYYQLDQEVLLYDSDGNILTHATSTGIATTFIWDYNNKYPVARVVNCQAGQAAFTSFESDGFGNWSGISSFAIVEDAFSVSGNKFYNATFSLSKTGLQTGNSYLVTYWSKNGNYSVTGTLSGWPKTLQSVELNSQTWTLYEHKVSGVSSVTVSGTGSIDELRLFPAGGQMTTYAYKPLVGIISECDVQGHMQYYEYDGFGRLVLVRDRDRNILKKICYNYAGQPETCLTNVDPIWQATSELRCQPCAFNAAYSTNVEERKEIDVNPNSPTYNAFRWVSTGSAGSCMIIPDWQNTSTPLRCRMVNGLRTGQQEQERKDFNPCSSTYNQVNWFITGTNTTACPLPVGNIVMSQVFTRTNCGPDQVGGQVTYTVPANTYYANEQVDANSLAQADITANGQNYANQNGSCSSLYQSHDKSGYYSRNTCNWYETPVPIYVSVPAGMFTSTTSQEDANTQALQYAQNYANQNGTCQPTQINYAYVNNTLAGEFIVEFTNVNTSAFYQFTTGYSGSGLLGTLPAGLYDITVYCLNEPWNSFSYQLKCTNFDSGPIGHFNGITVNGTCPEIVIN